jgi:tetratricopeptide (TPR) repeat protein
VPDPDDRQPLVLIPVSAEDASRRQWRTRLGVIAAALAVIAAFWYVHKRTTDPMYAQESFDAGSRLYKIARYNQAILSFDRSIALKSNFFEAYLMRGRSYQQDGKPEQAMHDFSKVIELRPNDPAGWTDRAALNLDLNNIQAAISDATRAIELDQKAGYPYNVRGAAYRKNGELRKSVEDLTHAVELAPTADNYYQRGTTYQALGEHKLAIADFDKVIAIIPDLATPFFARAASRRALGDEVGAKEDHTHGRILDGR